MEKNTLQILVEKGYSQRAIANALRIGQTAVRYWLKKHNLRSVRSELQLGKTPPCVNCQAPVPYQGRKYCSTACAGAYHVKSQYKRIELGILQCPCTIRRTFLIVRGCKCEICHREEWEGSVIPVVVDHIDGNSDNNLASNLRVVCCNCDALLPTYKSKNKGSGRHYRLQRRREGKSY